MLDELRDLIKNNKEIIRTCRLTTEKRTVRIAVENMKHAEDVLNSATAGGYTGPIGRYINILKGDTDKLIAASIKPLEKRAKRARYARGT